MTAEPTTIASRRFSPALRGYDRREVERFLGEVAGEVERLRTELDAALHELDEARAERDAATAVPSSDPREAFAALGEETTRVLVAAEASARSMRERAERETSRQRDDADRETRELIAAATEQAAELVRSGRARHEELVADAEAYHDRVVAETDHAAERTVREAEQTRDETIREGEARRSAVEEQLAVLAAARDRLVADLEAAAREAVDAAATLVADDPLADAPVLADAPAADAPVAYAPVADAPVAAAPAAATPDDPPAGGPGAGTSEVDDAHAEEDAPAPGADEPDDVAVSEPHEEPPGVPDDVAAPAVGDGPPDVSSRSATPRTRRAGAEVGALRTVLATARTGPSEAVPAVAATGEARTSTPTLLDEPEAEDVGSDPLARRDAALAPIRTELVRRARRSLQDAQTRMLGRLDDLGDDPAPVTADVDLAGVTEVARLGLARARQAGVLAVVASLGADPADDPGVLPDPDERDVGDAADALTAELAHDLAMLLTPSLAAGLDAGEPPAALAERVGEVFRDLKGPVLERVADRHLRARHGAGVVAGADHLDVVGVRWVPGLESRCPASVCAGDAAQGPVRPGTEFPSGHVVPPAHDGCTCVLVPA